MRKLLHDFSMLMVAHHLKKADAWLNDVWRFADEDEKKYVRSVADKEGVKIPYER